MKYKFLFIILICISTTTFIIAQDTLQKQVEEIEYFPNGKIRTIMHSLNGRWNGECIWNDSAGRPQIKETYLKGNKVGSSESYDNGIIVYKGNYNDHSLRDGEWTYYLSGKEDKIYLYDNGKIVKYFELDSNNVRYEIIHYKSIEEAKKNPLTVYYLDLRSKGLKTFPEEILLFKNLKYLDLSAYDLNETDSAKRYFDSTLTYERSIPRNSHYDQYIPIAGPYNRNKIKNIPAEISTLKKLKLIDLYYTSVNKREILKLKNILPKDCEVNSLYTEKEYE